MPITAYSDIPGYIVGLDFRPAEVGGSGPVVGLSTGSMSTSSATNLSGGGSTFANINSPLYTPDQGGDLHRRGMLCPATQDTGATRDGCQVTIDPGLGTLNPRRMLVVMCVTPLSMIGSNDAGGGRMFTTDGPTPGSGPFAGLWKGWFHAGSGGTNNGELLVQGGGGSIADTVGLNGTQRQIVAFRATFAGGAFGYCNDADSKNTSGQAGANGQITTFDIGCIASAGLNNNGPYIGVIHDVRIWIQGSGSDYEETPAVDAMDFMAAQWGVQRTPTKMLVVCGDSNGFGARVWESTVNHGTGAASTTLASSASAGATSLSLTASPAAWGDGYPRITVSPGLSNAEMVEVSSVTGSGPFTANLVSPLRNSHSNAATVCNNGVGFFSPYAGMFMQSRLLGDGSPTEHFNYSLQGSQAQHAVTTLPTRSPDGSMALLDHAQFTSLTKVYFLQRGINDFVAGGRSAAQLLADQQAIAANAYSLGADYVIVLEVSKRHPNVLAIATYNALLPAQIGTDWDAVAYQPWYLDPANTGTVTHPDAALATAILGVMYDSGTHFRQFAHAGWACAIDAAYSRASGEPVPYAPATPTATIQKVPTGAQLTWSRPSAPDHPRLVGTPSDRDGPAGLLVRVRRNGSLIATISAASINVHSGEADWTGRLSYTDTGYVPGAVYSVTVEDAAGNASAAVSLKIPTGSVAPLAAIGGLSWWKQ